jgi:choline-sulfatase
MERYGQDLPPFSMAFARRFSKFVYATVCAGKLHHLGPDQMQGWTSVRVPLIIRWPRPFAPRLVQENVNLCDLFNALRTCQNFFI